MTKIVVNSLAVKNLVVNSLVVLALVTLLSCARVDESVSVDAQCETGLARLVAQRENVINGIENSTNEKFELLNAVNHWLVEWDNNFQLMLAIQSISNKNKAQACLTSLKKQQVEMLSNSALYLAINQLDLVEESISTQHFVNRLNVELRRFGANLDVERINQITQLDAAIEATLADQWWHQPQQLKQQFREVSNVLGYPNLYSFALSQQMLTSGFELQAFLNSSEQKSANNVEFDSAEFEQEFKWSEVRNGLKQLSEKLFGLELLSSDDFEFAFSESEHVEAYQVFQNGQLQGQLVFVFDNGLNNFRYFPLKRGVAGIQSPSFLIAGGSNKNNSDNTISHGQLVDLLHQFGHFLHHQVAANQDWFLISGLSSELDFVEAPALLLEQWAWNETGLALFGVKNLSSEQLSRLEQEKVNAKQQYRKSALEMAHQSLFFFSESAEKTSSLSSVESSRLSTHCNQYPLIAYRCLLAMDIAEDLVKPFDQFGMMDRPTGDKLSKTVLSKGGSRPAADMLADYFNRPYSLY